MWVNVYWPLPCSSVFRGVLYPPAVSMRVGILATSKTLMNTNPQSLPSWDPRAYRRSIDDMLMLLYEYVTLAYA